MGAEDVYNAQEYEEHQPASAHESDYSFHWSMYWLDHVQLGLMRGLCEGISSGIVSNLFGIRLTLYAIPSERTPPRLECAAQRSLTIIYLLFWLRARRPRGAFSLGSVPGGFTIVTPPLTHTTKKLKIPNPRPSSYFITPYTLHPAG